MSKQSFVIAETEDVPSLSHVPHTITGNRYSVFSGSHSCDAMDEGAALDCVKELRKTVEQYFRVALDRFETRHFFGLKVDQPTKAGARDYSPHIWDGEPGILYCTPGKFSFSFLLADRVKDRLGIGGVVVGPCLTPREVAHLIAEPMHGQVASSLVRIKGGKVA